MLHFAYWLLVPLCLLLSGCASPFFSGLSSRSQPASNSTDRESSGNLPSEDAPRNPPVSDRSAPSDGRAVAARSAAAERSVSELLAAGLRNQRAERIDAACKDYDQVLRQDPANADAHFQLAVIADDQGHFADAERHYFALMSRFPENPNLLASLGWSYLLQGRYEDSERTLHEALQYAPRHQKALYNLGWLYGTQGNYDKALEIFRSAGTEAEAQQAIVELKHSARTPAESGNRQTAARERPSTRNIAAPTPWNDRAIAKTGGVASDGNRDSSTSPAQANRARQVDSENLTVGPDNSRSSLAAQQAGNAQPVNYDRSVQHENGQGYPVITPRVAGAGPNSTTPNTARWNVPPAGNLESSERGLTNGASPNRMQDSMRTGAEPPGVVPLPISNAVGMTAAAPLGDTMARRAQDSWQNAQIRAAQVGLAAGPGGLLFPIIDEHAAAPGGVTADNERRVTTTASSSEGRIQNSTDGPTPGRRPSGAPQLPIAPAAGIAPSSAVPATGSTPWPGRTALPAPIPTDVISTPQNSNDRAADRPALPGFGTGRMPSGASY